MALHSDGPRPDHALTLTPVAEDPVVAEPDTARPDEGLSSFCTLMFWCIGVLRSSEDGCGVMAARPSCRRRRRGCSLRGCWSWTRTPR